MKQTLDVIKDDFKILALSSSLLASQDRHQSDTKVGSHSSEGHNSYNQSQTQVPKIDIAKVKAPFHVGYIDIESIYFDTDYHDVTQSAHAVIKGFNEDRSETYFCKLYENPQDRYHTITSMLSEMWYSQFGSVSETRLITSKDETTGTTSIIGAASVGLNSFTETKKLLDLLTQGVITPASHTPDGSANANIHSQALTKQIQAFLKKYQPILKGLEDPDTDLSEAQYIKFVSDFDAIFNNLTRATIQGEELTLQQMAYYFVHGRAGMDVALMLCPDGDNHQCNNGISTNEHGDFQHSKIDHDYATSRLQALTHTKPIPNELESQMNESIIGALIKGKPVPLQVLISTLIGPPDHRPNWST